MVLKTRTENRFLPQTISVQKSIPGSCNESREKQPDREHKSHPFATAEPNRAFTEAHTERQKNFHTKERDLTDGVSTAIPCKTS